MIILGIERLALFINKNISNDTKNKIKSCRLTLISISDLVISSSGVSSRRLDTPNFLTTSLPTEYNQH